MQQSKNRTTFSATRPRRGSQLLRGTRPACGWIGESPARASAGKGGLSDGTHSVPLRCSGGCEPIAQAGCVGAGGWGRPTRAGNEGVDDSVDVTEASSVRAEAAPVLGVNKGKQPRLISGTYRDRWSRCSPCRRGGSRGLRSLPGGRRRSCRRVVRPPGRYRFAP